MVPILCLALLSVLVLGFSSCNNQKTQEEKKTQEVQEKAPKKAKKTVAEGKESDLESHDEEELEEK